MYDQQNPAEFWINAYLESIKKDGLGPTVHARNMYHLSALLYDTWLVYNPKKGDPIFTDKKLKGASFNIDGYTIVNNRDSALLVSMHFAAYRLLQLRFAEYSSKTRTMDELIFKMEGLGLDVNYTDQNYTKGSPAALGNYLANKVYEFGINEGAGDNEGYEGPGTNPINPALKPNHPGNKTLVDFNRWQPLSLVEYINQKGWDSTLLDWNNLLIQSEDVFTTPHWGNIVPFAMSSANLDSLIRDGESFLVYNNPRPAPYLKKEDGFKDLEEYLWNFSLVLSWSGHNDPRDDFKIDISPGAIGPTNYLLPNNFNEYQQFFDFENGGTKSSPHKRNPYTGKPYAPNIVSRGDYSRVIAEYWVDAVNTYSPPGHWMKILLELSKDSLFTKKWMGEDKELTDIEWSVKSQLILSGALHDAAISAWSIKAYYDFIRPISAIRWLSDNGQSSDSTLPNYHSLGLPLIQNKIELVSEGDPLVGSNNEHLNKIKLKSWKGPDHVNNVKTESAGVDWILAENWWPYQRYSFATPPFPGYVSGHSTFSIAAARVLEEITGSPFFPGGLKEVRIDTNFLEFEKGPSQQITLQWATYREAADETCLSRIWGGIHPPIDDIEGRKVGLKVAQDALKFSKSIFK